MYLRWPVWLRLCEGVMNIAELSGRIFKVNDALALVPILLGDIPPLFGYTAWSGVTVTASFYVQLWPFGEFPIASASATTTGDGSFSVSADVPDSFQGEPVSVAITVSSGVLVYRSGLTPLANVTSGKLNFWIYPYQVPSSDGVTAGSISSELSGANLPSGTTLTTGPAGLDVSGISEDLGLITVEFGVAIAADPTPNLASFVDLSVSHANIDVLFPASIFTSYSQILQMLETALNAAAGDLNTGILAKMEGIIESQEHVSAAAAQKFLTQDVSVTFTNISFADYTWKIGATTDPTIVMTADLSIGFPRIPTPGEPIL
jgi:hypothetical protein